MKGQKDGTPSTGLSDNHKLDLLGHELGNVLNGLLGMAELLGDSGLDAGQDRWLRAIAQSGMHMQSMIRSFRFFQQGSGLDFIPRVIEVDGVELLEQVITSHTPEARSGNNKLLLVTGPALPRHWSCDPCIVRQMLDNLVGNAVKFTRDGEIVLEAEASPDAHGALVFRISDNGPGIGPAPENRIFEAYQQGRHKVEDGSGNRGLGLFISREIVRSMNGRISCIHKTGGGACFEILLPDTLLAQKAGSPFMRSSLLGHIQVSLRLEETVMRSVQGLLDRLGVRHTAGRPSENCEADGCLSLLISEPPETHGEHPPCLLLSPQAGGGGAPPSRLLDPPVLESSLGLLLLEIVLEWRGLQVRTGKPGSAPTRR
jgi:hypothetical protein